MSDDPVLQRLVPEDLPVPEPSDELPPDPTPEPVVEEVVPDVPVDDLPRLAAPTDPGPGEIALSSLTARAPSCRVRVRTPRPSPPVRIPAKVVAAGRMRLALSDLARATSSALTARVRISPEGRVEEVLVRRPSGIVSFDESTVAAISAWSFLPERIGTETVASELTLTLRPARPRKAPIPSYPESARRRGFEGVVRLAAEVGLDGVVTRVIVLESSGFGILDEAATAALARWRFQAATVNGRPAPCLVEIKPIRFRLS
jgi:TonB family protein